MNQDKGPAAMKACKAACIGCGKCVKECKFEAITITNNLSYIDFNKCRLCKKCVEACPTKAIHAVNFPAPKPKVEVPKDQQTPNPKPIEPNKPIESTTTSNPEKEEEKA